MPAVVLKLLGEVAVQALHSLLPRVFVGRWRFLETFLTDAVSWIRDPSDPAAPRPIAWDPRCPGAIVATDRFPRGVEDDEAILRWLEPRYHPRVLVDDEGRLALRTNRDLPVAGC